MSKEKTIDYLFEDPPIPSQQFALISIIGPHMPQKCSVWGLKVRGVTRSLEEAKTLASNIHSFDNDYDIHTVEVGKFVPLVVDPSQIKENVYANEELNNLNKEYLKANQKANDAWLKRKNEMVKEAISEGKEGVKPTPIVTYTSMKTVENKKSMLYKEIEELDQRYNEYCITFDTFTKEEQDAAISEFNEVVVQNIQ